MAQATSTPSLLDRNAANAALVARHGDVLAVTGSTAPWGAAVRVGTTLAALWQASLTGCYVEPALCDSGAADTEPSILGLLQSPLHVNGDYAAAFRVFCAEQGVPHAQWVVAQAALARSVRQLAAWHSLAVVDRGLVADEAQVDILGELLLTCRLPVLLLPSGAQELLFERVLVAWDGSLESTRALHAAVPLLQRARKVVLLNGHRPVDEEGAYEPKFEPFLYLSRHGVDVEPVYAGVPLRTAGAALLDRARQMRADLLVMGAFGHSRLRERAIGGATRHILRHGNLPLLMQH